MYVNLCFKYEMHLHHIVICDLSRSTIFFPLSLKRQDFRKMLLDIIYIFWFSLQLLSEAILILRRTGKYMIINEYWCSLKIQVILDIFQWNLNFLGSFSEINKYQFHENPSIRSRVVSCALTDRPKGVVFLNLANSPTTFTLERICS
jgi:hypothetical protein